MKTDFNCLDRLISFLRANKIKKFIKDSKRICDLGCGDGKLLRYFHRIFRFEYALGVDYKAEDIRLGELQFLSRDISKIPVKDQSFDTVLMLAVIEHIELTNVRPILAEVHRILAKNGKFIITTPTPRSKPLLDFLAFKLGIISKMEMADHKHYYNAGEIRDLIENSGFKVELYKTFQFGLNSFVIAKKV